MSLGTRFVNYICLKYISASNSEGSLKGGTIFGEISVTKQAIPMETMGASSSKY